MAESKTDLRVRYTRETLRKSLLELMGSNPIDRITVTDICRKAGVNRGTFYKHYASPYDLLAQIQDELYQSILKTVIKTLAENVNASVLEEIFAAIAEQGDLCRVLLSENGDKDFLGKILSIAHDRVVESWKEKFKLKDTESFDMIYTFVASGSVGVIRSWVNGGLKKSPKEMALFIDTITNEGIYSGLSPERRRVPVLLGPRRGR